MGSRAVTLVVFLFAASPLAWGQPAHLSPSTGYESVGQREIFPKRNESAPVPETAEDAEGITRKPPRIWLRSEYMIWRIKSANFPTLATQGDISDASPGALDAPNTIPLLGGSGMDFRDRHGGRFSAGYWFDDTQTWGLEAGYFFLLGRSINQSFDSPGNPVLATPFFNTRNGVQDASLVTYPGVMSGQIAIDAPSFLQSAETNLTATLWTTERFRFEALGGFRYVNLSEGLHLQQTSLVELAPQYVGMVPFDGNTITVSDRFDTHNHFYGGQIGTRAELHNDRWSLCVLTKVAIGVSHQVVSINGFTGIDTQPATAVNAGLLAVSSNSGRFTRNAFAVVPEVGLNLGFRLTEKIQVFAGYSFLYWSSVARPGDQVDTAVNPNLVPTSATFGTAGGLARPSVPLHSSSFFAHGANFGVEFRY